MHLGRNTGKNKSGPSANAGGFTIIELMVAMLITIVVAMFTVAFEASVFQSNTQSIQMTLLTQEMRSAIQLISRDIRRSGYNDDALALFLSTEAVSSGVTMGDLDANGAAACLQVRYEDLDGIDRNAVYRLRTLSEIGRVSAHFGANADCDTAVDDSGWIDVSNPLLTDVAVLEFVHDSQLTDIAENADTGNVIQIGVEQINIVINASLRTAGTVNRTIVNEVQLRNQYITV